MVIALFEVDNKQGKFCFFGKTYLPVNIGMDIIFKILFLILSNVEINFFNWELG